MMVTPHWTELQTSHTHGQNKSCWCFKAFYYCLLWDQTLGVLTFLDWSWVYILQKILSCRAVCMCWMTILAVLKILSSDTSENWWEVWSGGCVSSLCFARKVNLLPLAGVRGHCVEIQTHLLKHHDIHQNTTASQSRRVCCTIRNIFYFLFFPSLFCLWEQGATSCISRVNYCVQAGSEQAENQVLEGFSSLEFVLQQTFYPVMAKVKKSEFRRLKTQPLCGLLH